MCGPASRKKPGPFGDLRTAHYGQRAVPKGRVTRGKVDGRTGDRSGTFLFIQVFRALKKCLLQTKTPHTFYSIELVHFLFVS